MQPLVLAKQRVRLYVGRCRRDRPYQPGPQLHHTGHPGWQGGQHRLNRRGFVVLRNSGRDILLPLFFQNVSVYSF